MIDVGRHSSAAAGCIGRPSTSTPVPPVRAVGRCTSGPVPRLRNGLDSTYCQNQWTPVRYFQSVERSTGTAKWYKQGAELLDANLKPAAEEAAPTAAAARHNRHERGPPGDPGRRCSTCR